VGATAVGAAGTLLLATAAAALDPERAISQYVRRNWSDRDGLPSMLAKPLAQTPDGYLWIGTTEGLARFDGFRFVVFNRRNTPEFHENEIRTLLADSRGCLWIGFLASGVVRNCGGTLARIGSDAMRVEAFLEEPSGAILVGTDRGLLRLRDGRPSSVDGELERSLVMALARDVRGRIWAATFDGRVRVIPPEGPRHWMRLPESATRAAAIAFLSDGSAVLSTQDGILRHHGDAQDRFARVDAIPPTDCWAVLEDRSGALWTGGTNGGGLLRVAQGRASAFGKREGLGGDRVLGLLEDREGDLWVTTWDGGLTQLADGAFVTYGEKDGLSSDAARTIFEDREGRVWVGTVRGLNRLQDGRWRHFGAAEGLPDDFVYSLAQLADGDLAVGTLERVARVSGDRVSPLSVAVPGLRTVYSLLAERPDTLWIGAGRRGVRLAGGRAEIILEGEEMNVYTILRDRRGTLWFGTFTGVYAMPAGAARPVRWETRHDSPRTVIFSSLEDGRGDLWFGTYEGGLFRVRDGATVWLSTRDGLFDDTAFAILEDGAGGLWISCARGIYRILTADVDAYLAGELPRIPYRLFGVGDGLATANAEGGNANAGYRTRDGRLWFATMRGVAVVDPANVRPLPPPPRPIVEAVRVDGSPLPAATLALPPGRKRVEIEYTAIHLRSPERLRFRHRLVGLDDGWNDAGARRLAEYASVGHGEYRFEVQASLDGAAWGEASGFGLAVRPYYWQTVWFAGAVSLALIGLGVSAARLRVAQLERAKRRLEATVRERSSALLAEQRRAAHAEAERDRAERELEARRELEGLVGFGRAVAGVLDPDEIVSRLDRAVVERWGAVRRAVVAWREGRELLLFEAGPEPVRRLDARLVSAAAAGISGWRQARFLAGVADGASASAGLAGLLAEAGAVVAAPLLSGETMFGTVALGSRPDGQAYGERDLAHLFGLATQTALALEGAWQAQDAVRWRHLSEARQGWLQLSQVERLAFAAVARHGLESPVRDEDVERLVSEALGGEERRVRAALERLLDLGALSREADAALRVRHDHWLLLPEIRMPLAELAHQAAVRVGAYSLGERIGAGGMAEVFRAVNVHDGSPAAIKLLHPHLSADPGARRRLEREGEIVAAIAHPNVVRLLERGEHDGRLYLAMELLSGETLASRLRGGPLRLSEVLAAGRALASALAALHARGVVHRDVNSANVMCEPDGRVVLLDLGLARGLASSTLTHAQTVLGTLPYMSPEQLRGEELDHRTDLWSLGVVIHEMATGELPWDADASVQMALEILGAREAPPRRLDAVTHPPLRALLSALLTPDCALRLADAAAVERRLLTMSA